MNCAIVGPTYPFRGGIAHYTTLLVRALRPRFPVTFVSFRKQYPSWLYPGANDKDPSQIPAAKEIADRWINATNPWEWISVAQWLRQRDCDLVLLNWSVAYWAPFYLLFILRLKFGPKHPRLLFICHNIREHESAWWKRWLSGRILNMGDYFIVHSADDKKNLLESLGKRMEDQIFVSPHPVYDHLQNMSVNRFQAREQLGIHSPNVVLFFGFIRGYKGLGYLLRSLPMVLKKLPIHLLVAGEIWGDPQEYLSLVSQLGVEADVSFFLNYIPDEQVPVFFASADLVAVPYLSATQSGIIQLAYGFSRPVLATRVGGLPEAVLEGKTGYLAPRADAEALAMAMVDFFLNKRGPEMELEVQSALSRFSWENLVSTIERISMNQPA